MPTRSSTAAGHAHVILSAAADNQPQARRNPAEMIKDKRQQNTQTQNDASAWTPNSVCLHNYVMQSMLCNLWYAIDGMQSMLCNLRYTIDAMHSILSDKMGLYNLSCAI